MVDYIFFIYFFSGEWVVNIMMWPRSWAWKRRSWWPSMSLKFLRNFRSAFSVVRMNNWPKEPSEMEPGRSYSWSAWSLAWQLSSSRCPVITVVIPFSHDDSPHPPDPWICSCRSARLLSSSWTWWVTPWHAVRREWLDTTTRAVFLGNTCTRPPFPWSPYL